MTIKVLVVDDSAAMRGMLAAIINSSPGLAVVGTADNPHEARELIKVLNPDVLTLDVEMPLMNGIEFLSRLMRLRPMPVLMISSLTERGSTAALQALELGAIDFLGKPRIHNEAELADYADEVCAKIRAAYGARQRFTQPAGAGQEPANTRQRPVFATLSPPLLNKTLIAIGASTGGTEAIRTVLSALPEASPGVLIVQHMPEGFTKSFAKRLDSLSRLTVVEAQGGESIRPGHAYLAPGSAHLLVRKSGGAFYTELSAGEPVNRHRPAVDVLFDSVARQVGGKALGVLLTGMGRDGAKGLLQMRQAGAWTMAQDEATSVIYGMPREAAQIGAVEEVLPLGEIAGHIQKRLSLLDRQ